MATTFRATSWPECRQSLSPCGRGCTRRYHERTPDTPDVSLRFVRDSEKLGTEAAGRDQRFWALAQALSALYPVHTEEKRWVDGVLARKKWLGFWVTGLG